MQLSLSAALWTLGTAVLVFVLGCALAAMMIAGLDPAIRVASSDPDFHHHGKPVVSYTGVLAWGVLLAGFSIAVAWLTGTAFSLSRRARHWLVLALLLLTMTYVVVVHPTLLLAIMGIETWQRYAQLATARVSFLHEIYGQSGLSRLKYHVLAGQMVLTVMTCFLAVAGARWRAHSAAGAQQPSPPAA